MRINLNKFNDLVDSKHISVQKHEGADLLIWNYTPKAQYDRHWTEETMMARGLITDLDGNVKALPFKKFFNYSEHTGEDSKLPSLPMETFEVFDKLDGSLGILYFIEDKPFIATRGSFTSDQALRATKMLWNKYHKVPFDKNGTYLFEIIYPENRIVVDYKGKEDLILLSAMATNTGEEFSYDLVRAFAKTFKLPIVKRFDGINDIQTLLGKQKNNSEGYVIKFKSGTRVKIKFEEYVRLHRLLTGVNARTIWDLLRHNQPFDELLNNVPDEYYDWVKDTRSKINNEYEVIEQVIASEIYDEVKKLPTRKEQAMAMMSNPEWKKYSSIVFKMLDNQPYEEIIWKMIKPSAEKPFREDIDL